MKKLLRFFLPALLMLSLSNAFSQNAADTTDFYLLSLQELMNIPITTASKFEQSIKDAPSTISLITRDQILKYGWLSGNEVLNRLPGFNISQDYDRQTVSSRGIYEGWNNNHMLMLIDGVPMNDNMYGTAFTWENTPMVFTKSLEVIRGPGSALYGTNATNGVISYNTLSAKDLTKKVEVRYRIGSRATQVYDMLMAGENEAVSFVSAFNYYNTNGNNYNSLDASGTSKYINNARSSYYFFNKIEGKGKLQGLSLQYHEQAWNFATGHGWLFYAPDKPENMNENRRLISLRYRTPNSEKKLQQEYVVRFQRHGVDWNSRLLPNDPAVYNFGLTEILKTHTSDIFTRLQLSYSLGKNSVLLGGVENSYFFYEGDDLHQSNVNLNTDFSQTANNELVNVGPYFGWLGSHPFNNTGMFVQYASPKLFDKLSITAGGRYDYLAFKFNDPTVANSPNESKSFSRLTPRLSLVYSASEKLTFKLMGGQAFRTPSPSELFGSNTYLLGSNPRSLNPEVITTFEFASDYTISKNINWRFNAFHTEFDDQIGYSVSNYNLSTNLYSLTSYGVENEFTFKAGRFDGFLNHSWVQRENEKIRDPTIAPSKSNLTWVPQQVVNLGVKYGFQKFNISTQAHYQGAVARRSTDSTAPNDALRGSQVDGWLTLDLRATYKPVDNIEIGIIGTNMTDQRGKLIKNNLYPFDYQITGRTILFDVRLMF
jgi:outer membrane receptor protein involved in Fe transport